MNTYNFIFSNSPRYRLSRHFLFWLCWFVFIVMAWQIPMSDVFPNWNIKARMEFAQKNHGMDFITLRGGLANMTWEIASKQLKILLGFMAFTYAIIYYIMPLYIQDSKKWIIITAKLILIFILFFALDYFIVRLNTI